ncbi:MAG: polysaccharide biosynthesis/export family protein [Opitutaceae bacterium]
MARAMIRRLYLLLPMLFLAAGSGWSEPATGEKDNSAASWRQRYVLGAGDILNFAVYGRPELNRDEVFVQPDGTISYLHAQGIKAAGLTIDELRAEMNAVFRRYYRNAEVMIFPRELRSKRYFILGKVIDNGAYPMDHPITILEAVARARGIETGLFEQNTVELADLPRAFLLRENRRMPVDFEALFFKGDLSQNLELEPGDFLYFPSANTNEVYVLGEVGLPGILGFTANSSVISSITQRGGFTDRSYRQRVLLIRGSLQKPERIVVDTAAILAGRAPDVPLQPKDIVYVSARPWSLVEDLTDIAIGTFLQSMTSAWASSNVGPFITEPVLPQRNDDTQETDP